MMASDNPIDLQDKNLAFAEPWNARAFALVLALSERGLFTLKDFQAELIDKIGSHEKLGCIRTEEEYYTHWVEALTALLRRRGLLSAEAVSAMEVNLLAVAATTREHQHDVAYGPDGRLRVEPLAIFRPNH
jgi:nitrile hydratase accessory protein